jgi:membrane fusion protein (multidrug efflux system)
VSLSIDAIPDHEFKGRVVSIAPASGRQFALLPADNATGNFTKIVQRLPVRIEFEKDSLKGYEDRIVPGLSVLASVRVR